MAARFRGPLIALLLLARQAAFVVELGWSGGFIGTARDGVTLGSDGSVRPGRASRAPSACSGRLTDVERTTLLRAADSATRHRWPASLAPAGDTGCCDRRKWTLRLHAQDLGGPQTFVTTWYDGNEADLPKDLASIRDLAVRSLERTRARCR